MPRNRPTHSADQRKPIAPPITCASQVRGRAATRGLAATQSALIDWAGPQAVFWVLFRGSGVYVALSLTAFAWAIYNRYLEGSTGQSTGRRIVGTRLVSSSDGQLIGPALAIVRHFVHIIDAIIVFLGFLLPLVDAKRQTIADKIIGTLVVKT
ncbi:MAG: RDD family protein [Acidimicrobiales bacterium]